MNKKHTTEQPAEISLNVLADSDFLSPYSSGNIPVISSGVAEFLENAASAHHPDQKLALSICGDCISGDEQPVYTDAIKNYYELKLTDVERSLRRKTFIAAWFSLIGILALAFMFLCDRLNINPLWVECIDIFAWVFLWEAVDQFFIERTSLRVEKKRYLRFIEMPCRFS